MPFVLLEEDESALLAGAGALMQGDLAAMERLVRTLLLSGFGTAICGNSLPASQGEHLISHYIDMLPTADQPFSFHGEQIGVTTLTAARLQERLLEGPPPVLSPNTDSEADFIQRFGASLGPSCWREFAQKRLTGERLDAANARIAGGWEKISGAIRKITLPSAFLDRVLENAGAPRKPAELGWPASFYATAVKRAREIRNRYTFLDLAADAKVLDEVIPAIV
jgi:glycerol-1-phosphate dehydrogenase [NAD(P)+]